MPFLLIGSRLRRLYRWLNLDPWWVGFALCCAAAIGLLNFSAEYAFHRSYGIPLPTGQRLFDELSGTFDLLILIPFLLKFFSQWPLTRKTWIQRIPVYLAVMILFGIIHTLLMTGIRIPLYPLLGYGQYDPGDLIYRTAMETAKISTGFWFMWIAYTFYCRHREDEQRRLRLVQLENELGKAKLSLLQAQLNPHFLFNSFNLISSVLYEDAAKADHLLSELGAFLRYSLRFGEVQEVLVQQELDFTRRYLEIMQLRFEERLKVSIAADPVVLKWKMPAFVLQPLVENSLKVALDQGAAAEVSIQLERRAGVLQIRVLDRGPGITDSEAGTGTGLRNIRARIAALYEEAANLSLIERKDGGTEARLELPFSAATAKAAPSPVHWVGHE